MIEDEDADGSFRPARGILHTLEPTLLLEQPNRRAALLWTANKAYSSRATN
jgi:hypothetical protein